MPDFYFSVETDWIKFMRWFSDGNPPTYTRRSTTTTVSVVREMKQEVAMEELSENCTNQESIKSKYIGFTSDGRFMCTVCGNKFTTKNGLYEHIKRHEGIFRYYCEVCGKGFRVKTHYKGHMNTHMDFRPFQCDRCHRTFSHKQSLVRHNTLCLKYNEWVSNQM